MTNNTAEAEITVHIILYSVLNKNHPIIFEVSLIYLKNQTSRDLGIEHLLIKIQPDPKRISFEQHIIENQLNNKDSIVKDVHPKIAYGLILKFECMS